MTQKKMNMVVKAIEKQGIKAELVKVQKNNVELVGITMGEGRVRPNMYFTEEHEKWTVAKIAGSFILMYDKLPQAPSIDADELMSRDYIEKHVHMKLVPDSKYITGKACKKFVDLYKLFYIDTPMKDGYITLTTQHLELAGVTVDELESWCRGEYTAKGLFETMIELDPLRTALFPAPEKEEQVVLSNKSGYNGAVAITQKKMLELACDKLGADMIYILPSSIHEVIALAMGDPEELRQMVCEVNDAQVVPQERLSYNVYKYERGGELEIA